MPHVLQSVKSVGNITRAELVTFRANLGWFRTPPAYRLYSTGAEALETTLGVVDYAVGEDPHYEWLEEGGGNPNDVTYHSGTGGEWVNVGDVAAGVWLNGIMIGIEQPPTAASTYTVRRVQLRRGTGSVWTELADANVRGDQSRRRTSIHIHGAGVFDATTDRVEARGRTAGAALDVLSDRRWGVRFGASTSATYNYAAARQVSDTNNEMTGAWNRLRANQLRIERRPSAQRYKTGSNQSVLGNTVTLVEMGASDWASDADMAPSSEFPNLLLVQQTGLYFVSSQVTFDGLDSGGSFAEARIERDATTVIAAANSSDQIPSSAEDTTVTVSDLVALTAGQSLRTTVRTGVNSTVEASRGTQMQATLMSSSDGVSPNRQVWARMPAPATWPNVAGMSSDRCPAGSLRALSDLTDRQWHRPAVKVTLTDDAEVKAGGGWVDIDCDNLAIDYTGLEATHGLRVASRGGIMLPWAGIWLVGARLSFSHKTSEGTNRGNDGVRGMRIALGDGRAVGARIERAMNATAHGWTRTIAETVVINADDGQQITLQGIAESITDEFGAAVVKSAHLWCVELGEGITRVPR